MLIKHVPKYDKHVDYAMYAAGYSQAVTRASKMREAAEEAGETHRNPTTGVYMGWQHGGPLTARRVPVTILASDEEMEAAVRCCDAQGV